jgi:hypothetical protein
VAICDRCGKETRATIMSMYNTEMICLDCKKAEEQRPDYEQARKAEAEAVQGGNFNFPGIGLDN